MVLKSGKTPTGCSPDDAAHCFLGSRFRVTVEWATADAAGSATAVPLTDSSGLFWFFNNSNIEMLVKVLDGCGINNHYWVFAAATTAVQYTLTVTDLVADQERTYFNPQGVASATVTDSTALQPVLDFVLGEDGSRSDGPASQKWVQRLIESLEEMLGTVAARAALESWCY